MADYYVSPDGDDTNDGATPGSPFRTITRAVELIAEAYEARGNVAVPEFVHLEPGIYSRGAGEVFPIIIPTLTEVRGSGRADCAIEYSPPEGPFECGFSDTCVELHGSLFNVSLTVNFPPDEWFPVIGVRLMDEDAILEDAVCSLIWVDAATRVSRVDFEGALFTQDGFERGGELFPLINDCHHTRTGSFNSGTGFHIYGGRVEYCSGIVFWINSPGRTIVQNNDIPYLRHFMVHRPIDDPPAASDDMRPRIVNNTFQSLETLGDQDFQWSANCIEIYGESYWEGNTIYVRRLHVGCDCEFFNNTMNIFRMDIGWAGPWVYDFSNPVNDVRSCCPEFRYNTFEQVFRWDFLPYRTSDEPEGREIFLTITAESCPVFENNDFIMSDTDALIPVFIQKFVVPELADPIWAEIFDGLPTPDFGGGGGPSDGGNLFHVPEAAVAHFRIDVGEETFNLKAEDNTWSYTPNIEIIGDGDAVTYDLGDVNLE